MTEDKRKQRGVTETADGSFNFNLNSSYPTVSSLSFRLMRSLFGTRADTHLPFYVRISKKDRGRESTSGRQRGDKIGDKKVARRAVGWELRDKEEQEGWKWKKRVRTRSWGKGFVRGEEGGIRYFLASVEIQYSDSEKRKNLEVDSISLPLSS